MSEAEEGNNGTADSEKPGDSQTGPFDIDREGPIDSTDLEFAIHMHRTALFHSELNEDGVMDLKEILRSIVPNWKETLVIIIAVSIFGGIAFSFLT